MFLFIPFQGSEILAARPSEAIDTKSLRVIWVTGYSAGNSIIQELRKAFPHTNASQMYGQTEASNVLTLFDISKTKDLELSRKNPTSCGRIRPGVEWKVSHTFQNNQTMFNKLTTLFFLVFKY